MLMCVCVVYRADLYTVFRPKADIVGQVLGPVCAFVCMFDQLSAQVVLLKLYILSKKSNGP